jgi:ABC-type multidrug transport system permease subunit
MVWVWPVLVWSQMGVRERRYGTDQILFSMPRPALRQLPALWMAGVVVAVVAGTGGWLYLALNGEITSLLAWFVGAFFVPALALALGVWVGNSRAFEATYLLLWYIGLIEQIPALDYAGATAEGLEMGMPLVYLGVSAGLLALALLGRRQQIRA